VAADAPETFALFFKNNSGPVFRVLLAGTLNRAAAEDATAEAFARAFANWEKVAEHPNPRAWVLRVAWNYYRSSWRKWEGRWAAELETPAPTGPGSWADPHLMAAIRQLPRGQREVIVVIALGEMNTEEAAEALGKAAGTIRSQLFRARAALREALGEEDDLEGRP
jgi:RNA polymerase sigma factor (sigma-70 family)